MRRGFSLVETLIAIFLLVILLTFILTVLSTISAGLRLSENHINAAFLGREILNEVYGAGFDRILSFNNYRNSYSIDGYYDGNLRKMNFDYQIDVIRDSIYSDMYDVSVTVGWWEKNERKRVILETIFTEIKY